MPIDDGGINRPPRYLCDDVGVTPTHKRHLMHNTKTDTATVESKITFESVTFNTNHFFPHDSSNHTFFHQQFSFFFVLRSRSQLAISLGD